MMKDKPYKRVTVNDIIHDERIFAEVARAELSHVIKEIDGEPPKYRSMSHFIECIVVDFLDWLDQYPAMKDFGVFQRGITMDKNVYERCKEYIGNSMRSFSDIVRLARVFYLMRKENGQLS